MRCDLVLEDLVGSRELVEQQSSGCSGASGGLRVKLQLQRSRETGGDKLLFRWRRWFGSRLWTCGDRLELSAMLVVAL